MNGPMSYSAELATSLLLSPQELLIWHGMGAAVHEKRMPDLEDAIEREKNPPAAPPTLAAQFRVLMESHMQAWGEIHPRAQRRPRRDLWRPCVIRGVAYPSLSAAGKALHRDPGTILRWLNRGEFRTIVFRGQEYSSIAAASRETGTPFNTVKRHASIQFEKQGQRAENGATNGSVQRLTATGSAA